ncbi:hypothetical protein [Actinoplanes palleronii]|nr:hypothetical protein [Actinoplanes palleronii]
MILLTKSRDIGSILRGLRAEAKLSLRQLAPLVHACKSAIAKREASSGMTVGALVDHAAGLGYAVALIPTPEVQTRPRFAATDFAAEYELLRSTGLTRSQIAGRLHMTRAAIDQAYVRAVRAGLLAADRRAA